jgi:Uma2 family endonuclease
MTVGEKVGMPLDEFLEQGNDQPFEIINGERIPKLPNVSGHSFLIRFLSRWLPVESPLGETFAETTYLLPDHYDSNWVTGYRIPDVMFYAAERWAAYIEANPDWALKPYAIIPDLVIEVISPTDRVSDLDAKIDAYLADGVRLIITIDPQRKKATVYAPDMEQPLHLSGDALLDLTDVIPGFQIKLSSLFEKLSNPLAKN